MAVSEDNLLLAFIVIVIAVVPSDTLHQVVAFYIAFFAGHIMSRDLNECVCRGECVCVTMRSTFFYSVHCSVIFKSSVIILCCYCSRFLRGTSTLVT